MGSPNDLWPTLPLEDGFRELAERAYREINVIDWDSGKSFLHSVTKAAFVRGHPDKLDAGVDLMNSQVAAAIGDARSKIELANASFGPSWGGRGGEAFAAYVPLLTGAMKVVQDNALLTAGAVADMRQAIAELWIQIVQTLTKLVADVISAYEGATGKDTAGKRKSARPAVISLVARFVEFVMGIYTAVQALYVKAYVAGDKLELAEGNTGGLSDVGQPTGAKAFSYAGPTGRQLPVPSLTMINPSWDDKTIQERWQPKSKYAPPFSKVPGVSDQQAVAIDTEMMQELINAFRNNGVYWEKASSTQLTVMTAHFTADAFGEAGKKFHKDLMDVMGRDRSLYMHSGPRMDAVGDLLDRINEAYHHEDNVSSAVLREYLSNEPMG